MKQNKLFEILNKLKNNNIDVLEAYDKLLCDKSIINLIITNFEKKLEDYAALITEAIGDVIVIANMNEEKNAFDLIKSQFVVIDKRDLKKEK